MRPQRVWCPDSAGAAETAGWRLPETELVGLPRRWGGRPDCPARPAGPGQGVRPSRHCCQRIQLLLLRMAMLRLAWGLQAVTALAGFCQQRQLLPWSGKVAHTPILYSLAKVCCYCVLLVAQRGVLTRKGRGAGAWGCRASRGRWRACMTCGLDNNQHYHAVTQAAYAPAVLTPVCAIVLPEQEGLCGLQGAGQPLSCMLARHLVLSLQTWQSV